MLTKFRSFYCRCRKYFWQPIRKYFGFSKSRCWRIMSTGMLCLHLQGQRA